VFITNNITGGFISTFSTFGPTNELAINPNVAAPGGMIYSTWPLPLGGYQTIEGTSMATPYISGIVALYLSIHGATSPLTVKNILGTTAGPVDTNNGSATIIGLKASVAQQGGGLVNAHRFIGATTEISPSVIELNVSPRSLKPLTSGYRQLSKHTCYLLYKQRQSICHLQS
jgi:subtilisin family serine protease